MVIFTVIICSIYFEVFFNPSNINDVMTLVLTCTFKFDICRMNVRCKYIEIACTYTQSPMAYAL